jgi:ketosteroid isomerase-like protein
MTDAREVMDRITDAVTHRDWDAVRSLYADDAVLETPDRGTVRGREEIVGYFRGFVEALDDADFEVAAKHEIGSLAIDEGWMSGTHSGPMPGPDGETIEPTGRRIRVRECDLAEIKDGVVTSHHMYFDQLEFMEQLGLAEAAA